MKTIPMVPACQNMEELHKLTDLICEYIHPQMVILFGYYAGMDFHNALKGYEILVIMEEKPTLTVRELVGYLKTHYPLDSRKEKNLSLHIFTAEFIHHRTSLSYFFYAIRKEGILLYESENCILKESVAYKPTRSYQQIVGLSDQCLALGRAFLQDAQRHIDGGIPRLAAYYLYQAVVQFLRAGNMVHYGFLAEGREDLVTTYLKIRYCTKEIAALWYGDGQLAEWTLFGRLQSFSYKTRFSYPYTVNSDLLTRCLTFTCKTEKVIKKFCKERIKFLETLSKSRENSQEEKSDLSKE